MFLMTVKQLMWLFFFISVLNIPVYYFYFQINEPGDKTNIIDQLQRFSIANTEREQACQTVNLAQKSSFNLYCAGGKASIDSLNFIGVTLNDNSTCKSMDTQSNPETYMQHGCYFDLDIHGAPRPADKYPATTYLQEKNNLEKFKKWFRQTCVG